MKTILITDTHFGTRQNSITWLNSQIDFFTKQLIPYIKKQKEGVRLVHLGDVFDSRSTISTIVASRVVDLFKQISELVDEFIIIGGNHDYYSPNSDEYDTLNLLLGNLNIKLVTKQALIDKENKHIYVPWYVWQEEIHAPSNLQDAIDTHNIQRVFTHADIVNEPVNIRCREIYSGHIHIPHCKGNIRNLGSTYSLNFADANSKRGFYVIDGDNLLFVENTVSIKFHRFYNGDIFTIPNINKNDYIELYINQSNMSNQLYLDEINNLVKNWKNVWLIPQTESKEVFDSETFAGYDIETITKEMIPENLKQKFNQILHILE